VAVPVLIILATRYKYRRASPADSAEQQITISYQAVGSATLSMTAGIGDVQARMGAAQRFSTGSHGRNEHRSRRQL
jgi:hypothetical protein